MYKVQVKAQSIRYKDRTHRKGDTFIVENKDMKLMEGYVVTLRGVKEDKKDNEVKIEDYTVKELKQHLNKKGIKYDSRATKKELLEMLK